MINFEVNQFCYGCTACQHKCPTKAITMVENKEGFLVPEIDQKRCINCGMCEKVCPVLSKRNMKCQNNREYYVMYGVDAEKRKLSTSGGFFFSVAEKFIEENGYVCGCIWNDDMKAIHIVSNKINDIKKMRGSKYVQSDLGDTFFKIKELLEKGNKVLFSGTPCQIAGIKNFIEDTTNLYTCGLICEGVPSPLVFRKNIEEIEKKYKKKIINYNFRDKGNNKWNNPHTECLFEDGTYLKRISDLEDYYTLGFYQFLFLRNSCYQCQYKIDANIADVIIGDYWGCKEEILEESQNMGVSAVIVLSNKGKEMVSMVQESNVIYESDFESISKGNKPLYQSVKRNNKRDAFFQIFNTIPFSEAVFKNIENNKIKFKIKQVLNKIHLYELIWGR